MSVYPPGVLFGIKTNICRLIVHNTLHQLKHDFTGQSNIYFDGLYASWQSLYRVSITDGVIDTGNGAWDWRWLCRVLVWGRVVFPSLDRPAECPVDPTMTPPTQLRSTGLAPVIDARHWHEQLHRVTVSLTNVSHSVSDSLNYGNTH